MNLFDFQSGTYPLLLSFPHSGTAIPDEIAERMTDAGKQIKDTDWYLRRLYDLKEFAGVSVIASNVSRYVVDLNRSSDNEHLYPGQNTTGLCPVTTFEGESIYGHGLEPDDVEIENRVNAWWKPYHEQLQSELDRLIEEFGFVVLWDCHSIKGSLPRLFEGDLPIVNVGTNKGKSCEPSLNQDLDGLVERIDSHSAVFNERFIGGFITRHYGSQDKVNAVQLELVRKSYMFEDGFMWNESEAPKIQAVILQLLTVIRKFVSNK